MNCFDNDWDPAFGEAVLDACPAFPSGYAALERQVFEGQLAYVNKVVAASV